MGKLSACAGETLGETLFSLLVVSLSMLMLSSAVLTAAHISRKTEQALNPRDFDVLDDSVNCYGQLENLDDGSVVKILITVTEQYNGDFYYD